MTPGSLNKPIPGRMASWLVRLVLLATLVFIGTIYRTETAMVFFLGVVTGALAFVFLCRAKDEGPVSFRNPGPQRGCGDRRRCVDKRGEVVCPFSNLS